MTRRLLPLLAALTGLSGLAGCQPNYGPTTVSVRMRGSPPDATVIVDDMPIASLAVVQKRGLALPPGRHRISVEREGYFPWDKAVDAKEELIQLDVELVKVPQQ